MADFAFPKENTTALLVISGAVEVNGVDVPQDNLLKFKRKGEEFNVVATEDDTVVLLFSGKPLNEPIYGMGPFVMSNHEDLVKAFRDFGNGKFGEM